MSNIKVTFQLTESQLLLALKYIQQFEPDYKPKNPTQLMRTCLELTLTNNQYQITDEDQQIINDLLTEKPKQIISLDDFIKQQNLNI